jgi:hypothetical protein
VRFSTFTEEQNELVNDHNSESDSKKLIESEKKRHKWTDNEISCILVGAKKYTDNKRISWKYKEFLSIDISTILMATKYKDLKKSLIFNELESNAEKKVQSLLNENYENNLENVNLSKISRIGKSIQKKKNDEMLIIYNYLLDNINKVNQTNHLKYNECLRSFKPSIESISKRTTLNEMQISNSIISIIKLRTKIDGISFDNILKYDIYKLNEFRSKLTQSFKEKEIKAVSNQFKTSINFEKQQPLLNKLDDLLKNNSNYMKYEYYPIRKFF